MREEIRVETLCEPVSHYTDVVRFGNLAFLSGAGPVDRELNLVGGDDVAKQARQVMLNIQEMLSAVGAGFGDVLKVTIFVTDIEDRLAINEVRKEFFKEARPASTFIEVSKFVIAGMKLEIEAVVGLSGAT